MYISIGKLLQLVFQEELEEFTSFHTQNALFGGVTGAIYKCTRGRRPMALSFFLGSMIGYGYGFAWEKGLLSVKF